MVSREAVFVQPLLDRQARRRCTAQPRPSITGLLGQRPVRMSVGWRLRVSAEFLDWSLGHVLWPDRRVFAQVDQSCAVTGYASILRLFCGCRSCGLLDLASLDMNTHVVLLMLTSMPSAFCWTPGSEAVIRTAVFHCVEAWNLP